MPFFRWFLGFAVLITPFFAQAVAGEIHRASDGIVFSGTIKEGDFLKIKLALHSVDQKRIYLRSSGGLVSEALTIGKYLRQNGIETRLPADSTCASACVLVFSGGIIRTAHKSSQLVVHMGSGIFNEAALEKFDEMYEKYGTAGSAILASMFEQHAAKSTLNQANFLLQSGVSLRLLKIASDVHHLEGRVLTRKEARDLNVINSD